jgi:peroxiredoxin
MNTMIRSLIPALSGLLLVACGGSNGGRTMDLHIEGAGGSTAYFDRFENNRPIHVDSVKLNADGEGTIRVPALPLDFYRISVGQEQLIVALDSAESLNINAKTGELAKPSTITGSTHTDALYAFYAKANAYDEERERLRTAIAGTNDTALISKFNAMNATFYEECKAFAGTHAGSPVALTALGKLNMQQELPLFKQVRESLRKTMPSSGFFAMFRDQVDRMEQQEIAIKLQEEEQKRLSNLLPIGTEAPEIRQQTPDGKTMALSELRGKVVLIDFWASWCRPCRFENPNVKKVYNKYAKKGFEIFGVSLDRDHASWVKAIKDDGLPWKQVSDLGFWNNAAAQEYGVSSIPFTVLVDREGRIIEKGLRAEQLDARLAELFGS